MADRSKFEEMLVRLINEDKDGAEALFHEIVVEKSRDIYESILEDEADIDEEESDDLDEADDEEVDESDDELEEGFDLDEFEVEADDDMIGGDPADDMMNDIGVDDEEEGDMGDMDMDDMDMDDDVPNLDSAFDNIEDALEDLKDEFEKMLSGDDTDGDDDMGDMGDMGDMDGKEGDEGDMDFDDEEEDDEEPKENYGFGESSKKSAGEQMREYVEKVGGATYNTYGKMGDNGVNTKSAVAGKNDMGGTTANLRGGESKSEGTQGGLANPSVKDMSTKNINVPGGKAGKTGFKKSEPGHGAEKKSAGDNGDKSTKSPINGLNSRSK